MGSDRVTGSPPIRILLVDDHPAVRHGLALLLASEGMDVCADAGGRTPALARLEESRPDLAIVDLSLDGEDGVTLAAELRERGIPVLVYSMYDDASHVGAAFAAGVLGYVTKRELDIVLVHAIREVAAGRRFVSPEAAVALAESMKPGAERNVDHLSIQEREVYALLGRGDGTADIAAALRISVRTAESYCERIQAKLGLNGMYELRHHAIEHFRKRLR